jgi:hypothetical protein
MVKEISVTNPFSQKPITLQQYLMLCGITLTNEAKFTPDASGIVDEGEGSLYYYGKGVAAFSVIPVPPNLNPKKNEYFITTPLLRTWASPDKAINPPGKSVLQPQLVSGGSVGTYSVNYRSEPLDAPGVYVNDSNKVTQKRDGRVYGSVTGTISALGVSTLVIPESKDMSHAFASIDRPTPWNLNQPQGRDGKPLPSLFMRPKDVRDINGEWYDPVGFASGADGVSDGKISNYDPYTPLLRGYQNDRVQVRALVGAHTQSHSFTIHGVKWLYEPDYPDSGYRNAHRLGISEHMEMNFTLPPATDQGRPFADYLYAASSGIEGLQNGLWGIMRSYDPKQGPLKTVGTPATQSDTPTGSLYRLPEAANARPYRSNNTPTAFVYPKTPDVEFTISAQQSPITYNTGVGNLTIANPNGIVYTVDEVAVKVGEKLVPKGVTTLAGQPLVLRAKAGDWVKIKLRNRIPTSYSAASTAVGLHSQLVAYDVNGSDGANVGFNICQTVAGSPDGIAVQPPELGVEQEYWWYAGDFVTDKDGWKRDEDGHPLVRPRELGAINLSPAAPINQDANGLVGALVVEPQNSRWADKDFVSTSASINDSEGRLMFKDFVIIEQNNTLPTWQSSGPTPDPSPPGTSPTSSAIDNQSADLTYRRLANEDDKPARVLSNTALRTKPHPEGVDPNTPIFEAIAGEPIRFRILMPGGKTWGPNFSPMVFELHGHSWQEEPYVNDAVSLGSNPNSQVFGAEMIVPHLALNILIDKAGGAGEVPGDYLYYNYLQLDGTWGILRVHPKP